MVKLDSPMVSFFFLFWLNFDQLAKMYRYISEERLKISKAVKSKSQELAPENGEIVIFQSSYDGGQNIHGSEPTVK